VEIIYVLTNEAMPGLVKIGKTGRNEVRKRLAELNSSSAVPLPFRCHFAGEVTEHSEDVEKTLHQLFASHRVNKKREFFRIDPELPVLALRLASAKDVTPQYETIPNEEEAKAVADQRQRRENTSLSKYGILPGSTLTLSRKPSLTCTVVDDTKVEFEGAVMSISKAAALAMQKLGYKSESYSGYDYWMFDDKTIWEIRRIKDEGQAESE
jgi:T5orf172 domain